ncbi:MAG: hypothetical protein NTNFB02_23740 [Nitrospira sp.]
MLDTGMRLARTSATGLLGTVVVSFLTGCLSPIALHRAVQEYDRTVSQVEAELLLLNIARARHHRPVHFTAVSSVAATFDFRTNVGIRGGFGPSIDSTERPLNLEYGASVAENPTVTIVPISGEEFTKRILRPLEESHFDFLAHQGFDINMILRLMARGMILEDEGRGRTVLFNAPARREEYAAFRQRLLHLASLQQARALYIEPLSYEEPFPVALDRALTPAEVVAALDKGNRWSIKNQLNSQTLTRKVVGRLVIANYEPWRLTNEERHRLNEEIQSTVQGLHQKIAGLAFAGARGISRVEISTDEGEHWTAADLAPSRSLYAWRFWSYGWTISAPGRYTLVVRATDGTGARQTSVEQEPAPDGATGLHEITVTVTL